MADSEGRSCSLQLESEATNDVAHAATKTSSPPLPILMTSEGEALSKEMSLSVKSAGCCSSDTLTTCSSANTKDLLGGEEEKNKKLRGGKGSGSKKSDLASSIQKSEEVPSPISSPLNSPLRATNRGSPKLVGRATAAVRSPSVSNLNAASSGTCPAANVIDLLAELEALQSENKRRLIETGAGAAVLTLAPMPLGGGAEATATDLSVLSNSVDLSSSHRNSFSSSRRRTSPPILARGRSTMADMAHGGKEVVVQTQVHVVASTAGVHEHSAPSTTVAPSNSISLTPPDDAPKAKTPPRTDESHAVTAESDDSPPHEHEKATSFPSGSVATVGSVLLVREENAPDARQGISPQQGRARAASQQHTHLPPSFAPTTARARNTSLSPRRFTHHAGASSSPSNPKDLGLGSSQSASASAGVSDLFAELEAMRNENRARIIELSTLPVTVASGADNSNICPPSAVRSPADRALGGLGLASSSRSLSQPMQRAPSTTVVQTVDAGADSVVCSREDPSASAAAVVKEGETDENRLSFGVSDQKEIVAGMGAANTSIVVVSEDGGERLDSFIAFELSRHTSDVSTTVNPTSITGRDPSPGNATTHANTHDSLFRANSQAQILNASSQHESRIPTANTVQSSTCYFASTQNPPLGVSYVALAAAERVRTALAVAGAVPSASPLMPTVSTAAMMTARGFGSRSTSPTAAAGQGSAFNTSFNLSRRPSPGPMSRSPPSSPPLKKTAANVTAGSRRCAENDTNKNDLQDHHPAVPLLSTSALASPCSTVSFGEGALSDNKVVAGGYFDSSLNKGDRTFTSVSTPSFYADSPRAGGTLDTTSSEENSPRPRGRRIAFSPENEEESNKKGIVASNEGVGRSSSSSARHAEPPTENEAMNGGQDMHNGSVNVFANASTSVGMLMVSSLSLAGVTRLSTEGYEAATPALALNTARGKGGHFLHGANPSNSQSPLSVDLFLNSYRDHLQGEAAHQRGGDKDNDSEEGGGGREGEEGEGFSPIPRQPQVKRYSTSVHGLELTEPVEKQLSKVWGGDEDGQGEDESSRDNRDIEGKERGPAAYFDGPEGHCVSRGTCVFIMNAEGEDGTVSSSHRLPPAPRTHDAYYDDDNDDNHSVESKPFERVATAPASTSAETKGKEKGDTSNQERGGKGYEDDVVERGAAPMGERKKSKIPTGEREPKRSASASLSKTRITSGGGSGSSNSNSIMHKSEARKAGLTQASYARANTAYVSPTTGNYSTDPKSDTTTGGGGGSPSKLTREKKSLAGAAVGTSTPPPSPSKAKQIKKETAPSPIKQQDGNTRSFSPSRSALPDMPLFSSSGNATFRRHSTATASTATNSHETSVLTHDSSFTRTSTLPTKKEQQHQQQQQSLLGSMADGRRLSAAPRATAARGAVPPSSSNYTSSSGRGVAGASSTAAVAPPRSRTVGAAAKTANPLGGGGSVVSSNYNSNVLTSGANTTESVKIAGISTKSAKNLQTSVASPRGRSEKPTQKEEIYEKGNLAPIREAIISPQREKQSERGDAKKTIITGMATSGLPKNSQTGAASTNVGPSSSPAGVSKKRAATPKIGGPSTPSTSTATNTNASTKQTFLRGGGVGVGGSGGESKSSSRNVQPPVKHPTAATLTSTSSHASPTGRLGVAARERGSPRFVGLNNNSNSNVLAAAQTLNKSATSASAAPLSTAKQRASSAGVSLKGNTKRTIVSPTSSANLASTLQFSSSISSPSATAVTASSSYSTSTLSHQSPPTYTGTGTGTQVSSPSPTPSAPNGIGGSGHRSSVSFPSRERNSVGNHNSHSPIAGGESIGSVAASLPPPPTTLEALALEQQRTATQGAAASSSGPFISNGNNTNSSPPSSSSPHLIPVAKMGISVGADGAARGTFGRSSPASSRTSASPTNKSNASFVIGSRSSASPPPPAREGEHRSQSEEKSGESPHNMTVGEDAQRTTPTTANNDSHYPTHEAPLQVISISSPPPPLTLVDTISTTQHASNNEEGGETKSGEHASSSIRTKEGCDQGTGANALAEKTTTAFLKDIPKSKGMELPMVVVGGGLPPNIIIVDEVSSTEMSGMKRETIHHHTVEEIVTVESDRGPIHVNDAVRNDQQHNLYGDDEDSIVTGGSEQHRVDEQHDNQGGNCATQEEDIYVCVLAADDSSPLRERPTTTAFTASNTPAEKGLINPFPAFINGKRLENAEGDGGGGGYVKEHLAIDRSSSTVSTTSFDFGKDGDDFLLTPPSMSARGNAKDNRGGDSKKKRQQSTASSTIALFSTDPPLRKVQKEPSAVVEEVQKGTGTTVGVGVEVRVGVAAGYGRRPDAAMVAGEEETHPLFFDESLSLDISDSRLRDEMMTAKGEEQSIRIVGEEEGNTKSSGAPPLQGGENECALDHTVTEVAVHNNIKAEEESSNLHAAHHQQQAHQQQDHANTDTNALSVSFDSISMFLCSADDGLCPPTSTSRMSAMDNDVAAAAANPSFMRTQQRDRDEKQEGAAGAAAVKATDNVLEVGFETLDFAEDEGDRKEVTDTRGLLRAGAGAMSISLVDDDEIAAIVGLGTSSSSRTAIPRSGKLNSGNMNKGEAVEAAEGAEEIQEQEEVVADDNGGEGVCTPSGSVCGEVKDTDKTIHTHQKNTGGDDFYSSDGGSFCSSEHEDDASDEVPLGLTYPNPQQTRTRNKTQQYYYHSLATSRGAEDEAEEEAKEARGPATARGERAGGGSLCSTGGFPSRIQQQLMMSSSTRQRGGVGVGLGGGGRGTSGSGSGIVSSASSRPLSTNSSSNKLTLTGSASSSLLSTAASFSGGGGRHSTVISNSNANVTNVHSLTAMPNTARPSATRGPTYGGGAGSSALMKAGGGGGLANAAAVSSTRTLLPSMFTASTTTTRAGGGVVGSGSLLPSSSSPNSSQIGAGTTPQSPSPHILSPPMQGASASTLPPQSPVIGRSERTTPPTTVTSALRSSVSKAKACNSTRPVMGKASSPSSSSPSPPSRQRTQSGGGEGGGGGGASIVKPKASASTLRREAREALKRNVLVQQHQQEREVYEDPSSIVEESSFSSPSSSLRAISSFVDGGEAKSCVVPSPFSESRRGVVFFEPTATPQREDTMVPSTFCTSCGHRHVSGGKFCGQCGHRREV